MAFTIAVVIGLDTNVLLRWLIDESIWPDDDPGQTRAVADLIGGGAETFFVNQIVLAETIWVLSGPMAQPKPVLIEVVERLLASRNVVVDRREAVVAALAGFSRGRPGFADHLIGHVNRDSGCETTVSFDKGTRRSDVYRSLKPRRR